MWAVSKVSPNAVAVVAQYTEDGREVVLYGPFIHVVSFTDLLAVFRTSTIDMV